MASQLAPDKLDIVSGDDRDPEDVAYTRWSIQAPCPASDGNLIVPYIHGKDAFDDMGADLARTERGDGVYILGFESTVDVPMAGTTLKDLLTRAAGARAALRGSFNADAALRLLRRPFKDNRPLHDLINALGGVSYLDAHVRPTRAHHQKVLVVHTARGLVGYCGGVDLAANRADPGWHDVHCRITGPASFDLFATFRARWSTGQRGPGLQQPAAQPPVTGDVATYRVQIGRTGRRETSAFAMIVNAIRRSTEFIYVEDQFAVCNDGRFREELKARLRSDTFRYLVILTCATSKVDWTLQGQAGARRRDLLDDLRSVAPHKVIAAVRRDAYVHAKAWVFDDKFAIIGSANMNNRGYFHDGEVVAGIADRNAGGTRLWFAHRLRMALWMKHLDISAAEAKDFEASVDRWRGTTAKIEPLTPEGTTSLKDDAKWRLFIDPS